MLPCEFCEHFKNTFFTKNLRTTASVFPYIPQIKPQKPPYIMIMLCAIWYQLHNLKNVKKAKGGVLLLAKLIDR